MDACCSVCFRHRFATVSVPRLRRLACDGTKADRRARAASATLGWGAGACKSSILRASQPIPFCIPKWTQHLAMCLGQCLAKCLAIH